MIPHPYTFAVLAVTRQFPEVLRHPLGGGVFSSWSHTRGTAAVYRGLRFCRSITPTTFSGGCLGSSSGEGRSELRYAQRCAEFRELQSVERIAPSGSPLGTSGSVSCSFYPPRTSVRRDAARATSVICEVACWECSGLHKSRSQARIPDSFWCFFVGLSSA